MKKFMMLLCLISISDLYANFLKKAEAKKDATTGKIAETKKEVTVKVEEKKQEKEQDKKDTIESKKESVTANQQKKQDKKEATKEAAKTEVTAGMDLREKDLKRYRFSQPNLQKIIMDETTKNEDSIQFDLSSSQFGGVHAADLSGATLTGANLSMFNLDGVLYDKNTKLPTTLTDKQKNSMKIINEQIATAEMDLSGKDLKSYYFRGKDIQKIIIDTNTTSANGVDFSDADATKAIFIGADLTEPAAIFINTKLAEANMSWGYFSGNDFSNANLQGAIMDASEFINANFTNAQLQNASIGTASWNGTAFPADVTGANFKGAQYNANTKLPASMTQEQKASMILVP